MRAQMQSNSHVLDTVWPKRSKMLSILFLAIVPIYYLESQLFFSNSHLREGNYIELLDRFESFDSHKDLPFKIFSATRWICRGKVTQTILNDWDSLIEYFSNIIEDLKLDQKFKVQVFLEIMLNQDMRQASGNEKISKHCFRSRY